jgi:outer membrane protein assembly factor BamB
MMSAMSPVRRSCSAIAFLLFCALPLSACTTKEPGHIVALDLRGGEQLWRVGGQPVSVADVVVHEGQLLLVGGDVCKNEALTAYDTGNGKRLWRRGLEDDCGFDRLILLPEDDLVVLPNRGGAAFDANAGSDRPWRPELATKRERYVPGKWLDGEFLFRDPHWEPGYGRRRPVSIEALDPSTSTRRWIVDLGLGGGAFSVLVADNTVLFELTEFHLDENGIVFTTSSTLIAVDAVDGRVLWRDPRDGEDQVVNASAQGGTAFIERGYGENWLEAIDLRSGTIRWSTEKTICHKDLAADAEVTVITSDGRAAAYETMTGTLLWQSKLSLECFRDAHLVIAGDAVYIAIDGNIHPFW